MTMTIAVMIGIRPRRYVRSLTSDGHWPRGWRPLFLAIRHIGWNRITRIVAGTHNLDLLESARLFALVNIVMADGNIAGWDSKFYYDFWRPITAIRAGETDGNPETVADPAWEPLLATPPVQDYPSTHSILGDAAAEFPRRSPEQSNGLRHPLKNRSSSPGNRAPQVTS